MKKNFGDKINTAGLDKHPENINKRGKEPGTKNRATILKKWIKIAVKIKEKGNPTGKEINGTVEDQINLALLYKAMAGDVQAIKEINDTLYGKITEKAEVKTDSTIKIKFIKSG